MRLWDLLTFLIQGTLLTPQGFIQNVVILLPTGSEEREVLGVGSIHVALLPSCHNIKIIALQLDNMNIVG